jgi:hypothetical protein
VQVPDLLAARVRLHVVTGKGGTGKTTAAAALGLALARRGRRVLLVEVEGRQGLARLFDTDPLGYEARPLARLQAGELLGLSVDAKDALLEYLEVFYRLGRAGRALERIGAVDFATTIAPGLRDVLLTGKVYDAVRLRRGKRRGDGPYAYDHVVLDAPPTGRIGRFLNVNALVADLARVGPVHGQAAAMTEVFTSSATAVHVVTLLEDMPVQETVDAVGELRGLGLPLGRVLLNQVRPALLTGERLDQAAAGAVDAAALRAELQALGVGGRAPRVRAEALARQTVEHAQRVVRERGLRERLVDLGLPLVELPQLGGTSGGVDASGAHELAGALT